MLESFTRDLQSGTRAGLLGAARRAYLLAGAALMVPGVLLGALVATSPSPAVPGLAVMVLYVVAVALGVWALRRALQVAGQSGLPARQAALTAAIQAATAPGVVFLLGCTLARQPLILAGFWITAALLHARVWLWLPGWVREPEPANGERLPST
ncbi:hypothetical protein [Deinococcus sp.]|uniref:hypothetical protein n=1 Tax=Deinococcus sp. TaxID=47478 RepID=UPI002869A715|nr:hypothetical protein [Deinococcus sp.]